MDTEFVTLMNIICGFDAGVSVVSYHCIHDIIYFLFITKWL